MRAYLCWNCRKLVTCLKVFPDGRPKRTGDCAEFTALPPNPSRITQQEMADTLGVPRKKVAYLVASNRGARYIQKALARHGIVSTYKRKKQRIYFYRMEDE